MDTLPTFFFAFLGGLVPALIWLWLFLREDKRHPEPKLLILLAFLAGMLSVLISLVFEHAATFFFTGSIMIVIWAFIEEIVKYLAALATVLWRKHDDEPIDPIIYMITVALGFAALETGLFLIGPLLDENIAAFVVTSNLRFLGAALLHVVSSAAIGLALAFSFYKSRSIKLIYLIIGIVVATLLHALFNLFIIDSTGHTAIFVFFFVWIGVIVLFLLFEKVKRIYKPLLNQ